MENVKITVEFNAEKYKALEKFAKKKGVDVNAEIMTLLDKLYHKNVPLVVQEYIEG